MKRELLLALEPKLGAVHRQHAVDGEVAADVAQELDVVERRQPLGVVDHHGVGAAVAELQELGEDALHALLVGLDLLDRAELPRLVLARGVADAGGAAAHQRDRLARRSSAASVSIMIEISDADVQRRRRAIVADIGDEPTLGGQRVEACKIRALVDEAALGQHLERKSDFECSSLVFVADR